MFAIQPEITFPFRYQPSLLRLILCAFNFRPSSHLAPAPSPPPSPHIHTYLLPTPNPMNHTVSERLKCRFLCSEPRSLRKYLEAILIPTMELNDLNVAKDPVVHLNSQIRCMHICSGWKQKLSRKRKWGVLAITHPDPRPEGMLENRYLERGIEIRW